jgi:hypothetical protein
VQKLLSQKGGKPEAKNMKHHGFGKMQKNKKNRNFGSMGEQTTKYETQTLRKCQKFVTVKSRFSKMEMKSKLFLSKTKILFVGQFV